MSLPSLIEGDHSQLPSGVILCLKGTITLRAVSSMNIAPEDFMSEEEWMIVTEKLDFFRKVNR